MIFYLNILNVTSDITHSRNFSNLTHCRKFISFRTDVANRHSTYCALPRCCPPDRHRCKRGTSLEPPVSRSISLYSSMLSHQPKATIREPYLYDCVRELWAYGDIPIGLHSFWRQHLGNAQYIEPIRNRSTNTEVSRELANEVRLLISFTTASPRADRANPYRTYIEPMSKRINLRIDLRTPKCEGGS